MATSGLSWSSEFGPSPCAAPGAVRNGIGRPDHQSEEEGGHDVEDERGPADHRVGGLPPVAPHEDGGDHGEDQAPQQDGAGQGRPHARDGVEQRGDGAVVAGDEDEREVVGDQRVLHGAGGQQGAGEQQRREEPAVARPARRAAGAGMCPLLAPPVAATAVPIQCRTSRRYHAAPTRQATKASQIPIVPSCASSISRREPTTSP